MGVGIGHQLVGLLGGGIETDGGIHPLLFGKGVRFRPKQDEAYD
jgi:hypothetical protein